MAVNAAQPYYPQIDKEVDPKISVHLQRIYPALNDHDKAIITVNDKVAALETAISSSSTTTTTVTSSGVTSFNSETGIVSYFPQMGTINDQSSEIAYTTQSSDDGALILLSDASAIAVTLDATVAAPWFATITNQGAGIATVTPNSGTINGAASFVMPSGSFATIYFDGTNWWTDAPRGGAGTLTSVTAGTGLNGGGNNGDITVALTVPVAVIDGGTGATTAADARTNLGAAASGANSDITSLSGLTTPLPVAEGGTGTATPGLVAGNDISITGTWPDQTVAVSGISAYLKGTVSVAASGTSGTFTGTGTVTGATTSMAAIASSAGLIALCGTNPVSWTADVVSADTVEVQVTLPNAGPTWSTLTFNVVVFP